MTPNRLYVLVAVWITATANHGFWSLFFATNGTGMKTWLFVASVFISISALNALVLRILSPGRSIRPMLSLLVLMASATSWFIDSYGVCIDYDMLRNVIQTNPAEARDFMGWSLLWRLLWQAGLPIWVIWKTQLATESWLHSIRDYVLGSVMSLVVLLGVALPLYVSYASFFRNQRAAEHLIVPGNVIRASGQLLLRSMNANDPFVTAGADARHTASHSSKPFLTLMVVGETARAANFSLGGYGRQTNPLLAQRDVLYFTDVGSCGTATAISVPCMFSDLPRSEFNLSKAERRDTVLDMLQRAGLSVTWVDNQSGCKGVCARIPTEKTDQHNTSLCDNEECLDEILFEVLEQKLAGLKNDSVLVLHQMGSHGPAYYRRVPPAYEVFKPTCATERIENCSKEQIINAYDNSILYTDHVLAGLIDRLKQHQDEFDSALVYVSDHGESLGEKGLYLHGEPYSIAPDYQKQVPMLMWFSSGSPARLGIDIDCVRNKQSQSWSHDEVSHTLLGLNDVTTTAYRPQLDLLHDCRTH